MLEIAVDSRDTLRDPRGIGRYVREVLRNFALLEDVRLTLLVDAPLPLLLRKAYAELLGSGRFKLARRVPRSSDVSWHPWNGTFYRTGAPSVATIHDVVPFAFPDADAHQRDAQQAPFLRSAASSAILTDSEFSAGEIVRHLRVPRERITVVPLAVDAAFHPGPPDIPGELRGRRYVLVLSTVEPHKNLATLIEGFHRASLDDDIVLAVRGGIALSGGRLVALPPLDESALPGLYRGALLVAAPSLYEGFGLPALEAMACGAPVLASRAGALPEVCGEAAAYVTEPKDGRAWARALEELTADAARRTELRERGPRRAGQFTWTKTASATLTVLRAAAQARSLPAAASAVRS